MRVPITKLSLSTAAAVGTAVLLAACSDSTTAPSRGLSPSNPDLAVVLQQTINSGSNISYCGYNSTQTPVVGTVYTAPAGGTPCVAAQDLQTALATYNPGWGASFNGTDHWIGPTDHLDPTHFPGALSNQYVADVGSYQFQTTFTVPNNAISLTNGFSMQIKSDNAVAVYLNGTFIGGNTPMQDCPVQQTNCNWTALGAITVTGTPVIGLNTVRIDLLGSAIGYQVTGTPRSNCGVHNADGTYSFGPQFFGFAGFSGPQNVPTPQHLDGPNHNLTPNWVIATCKNPTGVDFTATVSYDTQVTSTIWCSPGFWKNHLDAWSTTLQNSFYNANGPYPNDPQTFVGYDFGKKVGLSNPTMVQVISNPSIYGGPATNNVASFISNQLFGTPMSANPAENCPDPLPLPIGN